jgi:hypothetical protein
MTRSLSLLLLDNMFPSNLLSSLSSNPQPEILLSKLIKLLRNKQQQPVPCSLLHSNQYLVLNT